MTESQSRLLSFSRRTILFATCYLVATYSLALFAFFLSEATHTPPVSYLLLLALTLPTSALVFWLFSDQNWIMYSALAFPIINLLLLFGCIFLYRRIQMSHA